MPWIRIVRGPIPRAGTIVVAFFGTLLLAAFITKFILSGGFGGAWVMVDCEPACRVTSVDQDGKEARQNARGGYVLKAVESELTVKTSKGEVSGKWEPGDSGRTVTVYPNEGVMR